MLPLQGSRVIDASAEYDRAERLFMQGSLEMSQQKAARGYRALRSSSPELAGRFQLLEAEILLWRGMNEDALRVLTSWSSTASSEQDIVREKTLEGSALKRLQRFTEASQRLSEAEHLCAQHSVAACGGVMRSRGVLAMDQGQLKEARDLLLRSLSFARLYDDQFSQAIATLNLSALSIQQDHFDEALDWSNSALNISLANGYQDLAQAAQGNLGFAYFRLGDNEKALQLFLQAREIAARLGNYRDEINWLDSLGYVYQDNGDLSRAYQSEVQAFEIAKQIKSAEDILNSLEDLSHLSVKIGKLEEAQAYVDQAKPLVHSGANRVDALDVLFSEGQIAAARQQDQQAEAAFRTVEHDPASQSSMKLDAEHRLALMYEQQTNRAAADRMYRTTLATFESARDQLKKEDSEIPFVTNATAIYGDYIRFLIAQGKSEEALRIADQGRAQTLEQGLGISNNNSIEILGLKPTQIARKTNATLLFYWLGANESYLWVINPRKITLVPLPAQRQIAQSIERYRKALLGLGDPAENSDPDGLALYRLLLAPAAGSLSPGSNVIVLSDGALGQLNFETLIVPSPHPHYFIEDATVASAPSLHLLAAAAPAKSSSGRLLLIGNAVSPNQDYPELPEASSEMQQIEEVVPTQNDSVYSDEKATPSAYLDSNPQRFTLIHFVAHGVASRTDPLDSAIILSRSTPAEDSFKLHARDIIRQPIRAQLVTISACYGSGTRSYAGEGPVGLAWAFLHAGAHNVIGALWEVSDESTPQLMGDLYRNLERKQPPSSALRQAKLSLLHSGKSFRKPFYWAPFQLYTGL